MNRHWLMVIAVLVIAAGCDHQSAPSVPQSETVDSEMKTETSIKQDARQVLNDAIAAAKADDKALFVEFSADS